MVEFALSLVVVSAALYLLIFVFNAAAHKDVTGSWPSGWREWLLGPLDMD